MFWCGQYLIVCFIVCFGVVDSFIVCFGVVIDMVVCFIMCFGVVIIFNCLFDRVFWRGHYISSFVLSRVLACSLHII